MNKNWLLTLAAALFLLGLGSAEGGRLLLDASQKKAQGSGGAETQSKGDKGQRSEGGPSVEEKFKAGTKPLRSSDVMEIRFNPPFDREKAMVLVPNMIYVDVRPDVNPESVSISTGPTGTGVADAWRGYASTNESTTLPSGLKRFEIRVPNCREVGDAFEVVVMTSDKKTFSTYEGAFSCRSIAARDIKVTFPSKNDVLQVGHTYVLRWEGGDPNYPVEIKLGRFGWKRPPIVLSRDAPNTGSFTFAVSPEMQRGEVDSAWVKSGKDKYYVSLSQRDAGVSGGTGYLSIVR
jgi:hypothetical protein